MVKMVGGPRVNKTVGKLTVEYGVKSVAFTRCVTFFFTCL